MSASQLRIPVTNFMLTTNNSMGCIILLKETITTGKHVERSQMVCHKICVYNTHQADSCFTSSPTEHTLTLL